MNLRRIYLYILVFVAFSLASVFYFIHDSFFDTGVYWPFIYILGILYYDTFIFIGVLPFYLIASHLKQYVHEKRFLRLMLEVILAIFVASIVFIMIAATYFVVEVF